MDHSFFEVNGLGDHALAFRVMRDYFREQASS
jgi:hypothetical protein